MQSIQIRLMVDRRKISWLKFLLESYEGLALPVTLDAATGNVLLLVGPGAENEVRQLLAEIKDELGVVDGLGDTTELPGFLTGGD
jgi:hypothetical protein